MGATRKPCARCGGPKGPGARRRYCDGCVAPAAQEQAEKNRERASRAYHERPAYREAVRSRAEEQRLDDLEWAQVKAKTSMLRARGVAIVEHVHPLVVLEKADGVCGICGNDVDPARFDMDHIIPISRGGEHSYANVQPSHPSCNRRKSNNIPEGVTV